MLDRNRTRAHRVVAAKLRTGSFAAASNVTGALEDTESITRVLHEGGALSFWDYATAAPHVDIDMNPEGSDSADSVSHPGEIADDFGLKTALPCRSIIVSGHLWLIDNALTQPSESRRPLICLQVVAATVCGCMPIVL